MPRRRQRNKRGNSRRQTAGEAKRPVGRPRVLTEDKKHQVLAFVAGGGSRKKAAAYVAVSVTTLADEARRNPDFSDRLEQAEATCYIRHLQNVSQAGTKDWKASAFLLERKWPEEFGKTRTTQVNEIPSERPVPRINIVQINTREEAVQFQTLQEFVRRVRKDIPSVPIDDTPEPPIPTIDECRALMHRPPYGRQG
jgi:hypothetical protein